MISIKITKSFDQEVQGNSYNFFHDLIRLHAVSGDLLIRDDFLDKSAVYLKIDNSNRLFANIPHSNSYALLNNVKFNGSINVPKGATLVFGSTEILIEDFKLNERKIDPILEEGKKVIVENQDIAETLEKLTQKHDHIKESLNQ